MDLSKTNFLVIPQGASQKILAFKRNKSYFLFGKDHKVIRPILYDEWWDLKTNYPDEVKEDGLYVNYVWTLVPIPME